MHLTADAHVHLYPCYDLRLALDNLRHNLAGLDAGAVAMAFLAERSDCHFFRELVERAPEMLKAPVRVERFDNALLLREEGYPDIYIFAGRQVISAERVELLALTTDTHIPDGLPAFEAVELIRRAGGVPVISWAPGKWFCGRGKVVENLLERFAPGTLLVGDTSLRPVVWLTPVLMKWAIRRGFGLVAGSDPLPFPGEEKMMGTYGIRMEAEFDRADPARSMRAVLCGPEFLPQRIGKRGGLFSTLRRLIKNSSARKGNPPAGTS
jgi:hypothetical protein